MKWVRVESSVFRRAAYDEGKQDFYLRFHSGEVYRYLDLPERNIRSFPQRIPKAVTSGRTFWGSSLTRGCIRLGAPEAELFRRQMSLDEDSAH